MTREQLEHTRRLHREGQAALAAHRHNGVMVDLPTGTVTFLFTDIEGSTRLVNALGDRYADVLGRHHSLLREAVAEHQGVEVMTEGDAFFVVFPSPPAALSAAMRAQQLFDAESWPPDGEVRSRMGMHTGQAVLGGDNYVGLDVHRAARIAAAGHGGQVLLSDATRSLVERALPEGAQLRDLGQHRLKDLPTSEHLYQLVIDGLAVDFPPIRSLDARPNNLPLPTTTFIGREQQVADITRRLATSRLVTLTGPGGTGKTRLSVRVAQEMLDENPDGCWFVPLDALRDPELVPSAIAGALNVRVPGDRPPIDALSDWLRERRMLIVLDNFEQVTGAAPYVSQLLSAAPGLRVLATSRIPLHLYGEAEYAVPPLATVEELRGAAGSPERLSQYEAVQLFIERAVAVKRDFAVNNANAPAVAEICARLDGLPLAIELAAARIKLLAPEQILARLEQNLGVLTSAAQDLPERQKTMRGAIDWSFQLLEAGERRLFERASVFRGGFTLDSAEQVIADPALEQDVFEGLASLADKSLLRTVDQPVEVRFAMLETIREFATETLATSSDALDVRRRHAEHYFALAGSSEEHLTGANQVEWLDRLEREHDNLRSAFSHAGELGLIDGALEAAGAIWRFWQQRGHFMEARSIYERLLALPGASPAARAKALLGAGGIAYWQNDFVATGRWYREARELYEMAGDSAGLAEALYNEAYVPLVAGDFEPVGPLATRSRDLFLELGDESGAAKGEQLLGYMHYFAGRPADALSFLGRAAAIYRRTSDLFLLADVLTGIAYGSAMSGDWDRSVESLREALAIFAEAGNEVGMAIVVEGAGAAAAFVGQRDLAARLFGAAEAAKERLGGAAPGMLLQTRQHRAALVEALGQERFDELAAEGAELSFSGAVDLARSLEPPLGAPPLPPPEPWGIEAERRAEQTQD